MFSLAVSPTANLAVWGCFGDGGQIVDLDTQQTGLVLAQTDIRCVAISPDGKTAVTGGDRTVVQWDLSTGKQGKKLGGHRSVVSHIGFLASGEAVTAGGDGQIKLHNLKTGKSRLIGRKGKNFASGLKSSTHSNRVVWTWVFDLVCWNIEENHEEFSLRIANQDNIIAMTRDAKYALLAGERSLWLLDLDTQAELWTIETQTPPRWAEFFSDGQRFVCSPCDSAWLVGGASLEIRDTRTGKLILGPDGHLAGVDAIERAPDGTIVTSSRDNTVRRWTGAKESARVQAPMPLGRMTLHADGRTAVVAAQYGRSVAVIQTTQSTPAKDTGRTERCDALVFTQDGKRLALGAGSHVDIVSFPSFDPIVTLAKHKYLVQAIAWSWDGRRISTGSQDGSARVYDTVSGDILLTTDRTEGNFVSAVALSSRGDWLLVARGAQLALWDVLTQQRIDERQAWGRVVALRSQENDVVLAACERETTAGTPGRVGKILVLDGKIVLGVSAELTEEDQPTCITAGEADDEVIIGTTYGLVQRLRLR